MVLKEKTKTEEKSDGCAKESLQLINNRCIESGWSKDNYISIRNKMIESLKISKTEADKLVPEI